MGINIEDCTDLVDGTLFSGSYLFASVANGAKVYARLTTMNDCVSVTFEVNTTGKAYVRAHSGATYSAAGTVVDIRNRNTVSSNTIDTLMRVSPTVTSTGTQVGIFLVPGGSTGGTRVGATRTDSQGFILGRNTDYLFEFENAAGSAANISINIAFTEVPTGLIYGAGVE